MSWKPKYLEQTWEFGSLKYKAIKDLDTSKIIYTKGNPDVAEVVEMINSLALEYHKLLNHYVNMYKRSCKIYR